MNNPGLSANDWRLLVEALRQNMLTQHPSAVLERMLAQLQQNGWEIEPLRNWIPSVHDIARMNRVSEAIKKLLSSNDILNAQSHADAVIAREFGSQNGAHWGLLGQLAKSYLITAMSTPATPGPVAQAVHSGGAAAQPARDHIFPPPPPPPLTLPHSPPRIPSGKDAQITIYIDESWSKDDKSLGVIGGMVWLESSPNFRKLPWIKTHSFKTETLETLRGYLDRLYRSPLSFPFIMPIRVNRGTAEKRYGELIGSCLQLVLGWLLPAPGTECKVSVQLERQDSPGFPPGTNKTEFYHGVLQAAGQANPKRLGSWQLREMLWCPKPTGYIAYADLLAHLGLEHTPWNRRLGKMARARELPGYLPFSFDLLPLLSRFDGFESGGNIGDFLNLASCITGTSVLTRAIETVREALARRPELRRNLLEELDRRYMDKNRNLHSLHRQLLAVKKAIGPIDGQAGVRLSFLWSAIELQDANHLGNPTAVDSAAQRYVKLRETAAQHDRDLAVHTDLHLAVHEVDLFRFERAEIMMEEIRRASWFDFLSPFRQAVVLSSLGQHRSIGQQFPEAEELFQQAIALLQAADLTPEERRRELLQTQVYRAINACDGGLPEWRQLLEEAVCNQGETLAAAARRLAQSDARGAEYQHHLLVRSLFFKRDALAAEMQAYLKTQDQWAELDDQHPCELIGLYRALLRWRSKKNNTAAAKYFRAILGPDGPIGVGATIQLIGAMIAAVAWCCTQDPWFESRARDMLKRCQKQLPDADPEVHKLLKVLDGPSLERISDALFALPFNFH